MNIEKLLQTVVEVGGSDLHMAVANPPVVRVNGELKMVQADGPLTAGSIEEALKEIVSEEDFSSFRRDKELDFSYGQPGLARFRVNASYQRGTVSLCFRVLPPEIPSVDQLGLPPVCVELLGQLRGLVLVTGATGSGKSTTLAAMVDHLNANNSIRIITLEDPIEFLHLNKRSMIIQREIGGDTHSFSESLRRALRQDPDVIMVGELRDLESVSLAITAAETGHLVLGTLHTNGAAESVERLVGIFPGEQQQQIQFQLSTSIAGVIYQTLLPRLGGKGSIAAFEVLVGTNAIRNRIRQNQMSQIRSYMFMGGETGMQTLEQSLTRLVQDGLISRQEAYAQAPDQATLDKMLAPASASKPQRDPSLTSD